MNMQLQIFCPSIAEIEFDLQSRDEIPKLLIGIQAIHEDKIFQKEVFKILEKLDGLEN